MNTEALFLFLILLLGLLLCSFLGGNCGKEGFSANERRNQNMNSTSYNNNNNNNNNVNRNRTGSSTRSANVYDNYNHYTGNSNELSSGSVYYGPEGTTATVIANSDGTQSLEIVLPGSGETLTFTTSEPTETVESYVNYNGPRGSATTFYGPNGAIATVVQTNNGQIAIKVTTDSGTYYYNVLGENTSGYNPPGSVGPYNPPGTNPPGTNPPGYNTPGYNPPGAVGPYNPPGYNPPGINPPGYNPPGAVGPYNPPGTNPPGNDYYNSLPPGIPASQIPPGKEDLYILKSEIVPPVCPVCPVVTGPRQEQCPPCPACARCPEPSFECKKVPNYNAINSDFLPTPVLNDFSQFGM